MISTSTSTPTTGGVGHSQNASFSEQRHWFKLEANEERVWCWEILQQPTLPSSENNSSMIYGNAVSNIVQREEDVIIISDDGLVFKSDNSFTNNQQMPQLNSYYIKKADLCKIIEGNTNNAILLLTGDGKLLKFIRDHDMNSTSQKQIVIHDEDSGERTVTTRESTRPITNIQYKLYGIEHFYYNEGKATSEVVVKDIDFGMHHGIVLTEDGKCFSFGFNYYGCLGHDYYTKIVDTSTQSETVSYSERPYFIQTLSKFVVKQVCAGDYHTICVTEDGRVFSFGLNQHGQLGTGDTIDRYYASPVTKLMKQKIEKVSCGSQFSLVLSEEGQVFGFGSPKYICQTNEECSSPTLLALFDNIPIDDIRSGSYYSIAISRNKDIFLWGEYIQGKVLLQPVTLNRILPTDQTLSALSCSSTFLFFSTSNTLSKKDILLNNIKDLEMNVKKEALILKERTQHLITITKELEKYSEESKESIVSLSMSYMNLVNSRSDNAFTLLLNKSKEIYNSLIYFSGDMTEINASLSVLNVQIKEWNKQKHELSLTLSALMNKYNSVFSTSGSQSEAEKTVRSSLNTIFKHNTSSADKEALTQSLDKIYTFREVIQEQSNTANVIEEALNNELTEEDLDFDQFDKEIEMHANNYNSESIGDVLESYEQDFFLCIDDFTSRAEEKLNVIGKKTDRVFGKTSMLSNHLKNTSSIVTDILSLVGKESDERMVDNLKQILDSVYLFQLEAKQKTKENEFLKSELEKSRKLVGSIELKNNDLQAHIDEQSKGQSELLKQITLLTKQVQTLSSPKEQPLNNSDSFLQSRIEKLEETKENLHTELSAKNNEIRELEKKISNMELKFNQERWEKETLLEDKTRIQTTLNNMSDQLSQVETDNLKQLDEILSLKTLISNLKGGIENLLFQISGELKKFQIELPLTESGSSIEDLFVSLKQHTRSLIDFTEQSLGEKEILRKELYLQLSNSYGKQKEKTEMKSKENKDLNDKLLWLQAQLSIKDSEINSLKTNLESIHTACETYEENYKQMEMKYLHEKEERQKSKQLIDDLKEKLRICSLEYMDMRSACETLTCDLAEAKQEHEFLLGELDVYVKQMKERTDISYLLASELDRQMIQKATIFKLFSDSKKVIHEMNHLLTSRPSEEESSQTLTNVRILEELFESYPNTQASEKTEISILSHCEDMDTLSEYLRQHVGSYSMVEAFSTSNEVLKETQTKLSSFISSTQTYIHDLEKDIGVMRNTLQDILNHIVCATNMSNTTTASILQQASSPHSTSSGGAVGGNVLRP
ncbi:hypothetical protein C9374_002345 [Naegleria lovaniensis]|uniref:Uncharacterized protein n=1 Tax=Naegleria lovaniensis TaxID=51637 RepID=A0AA88GVI4_NAELO|nr:uncharacterized protein C9374_002345 [Naegleria lovaniensis]KAG2386601.1 hypothetical protein C9374_002345 [Naegleria lovaniensis]